jgi:hypothetical protein
MVFKFHSCPKSLAIARVVAVISISVSGKREKIYSILIEEFVLTVGATITERQPSEFLPIRNLPALVICGKNIQPSRL